MRPFLMLTLASGAAMTLVIAEPANAQRADYDYCSDRAADISGYDGRRPGSHRRDNVVRDAIRGGITGRVASGVFGGDKRDRDRASRRAARGAILGGIIRRSIQKDRDREARRRYRRELDRCMEGY